MALSDHFPVIDDRTFADLMTEARARIPRYTPEWTDQNTNEPGMALLELFAWMTELLVFRLGKVPRLNHLKFLQLMGIELSPARPAVAEVTFPVRKGFTGDTIEIPRHTQVSAAGTEGKIIFETDEGLVALGAPMDAVQAFDGFGFSDLSEDNDAATAGFHPFGPVAAEGAALLLGFDAASLPQVELNLAVWVMLEAEDRRTVVCGFPTTGVFTSASLAWEYWNGTRWARLTLLRDDTQALTRSGHVYLKTPALGAMANATLGAFPDARLWIRARLETAGYDVAPRLLAVRPNTVSVTQAQTVVGEILGGSDASPDQVFGLVNTPVLDATLELELDEGEGWVRWTEVDDFTGSTADDPHYVLNRTTGEVRFGDGQFGRIPVANPARPGDNVIARTYRFGGGSAGNVAAGAISRALSSLAGIDTNTITNLEAAAGGTDEESLDAALDRAPASLKSRDRAVTVEDYELLATQSGNVARAKAIPLLHPDFPGVEVPGAISVIIVPDTADAAPRPSEGLLRTVCAYLDQRRLLTTEVYVLAPTYREVVVHAELIAEDDADPAALTLEAEAALDTWFHPLHGGEDGAGWPFGGDIYYARLVVRLLLPGVARPATVTIEIDGEAQPDCRDVSVPDGVLLTSGAHVLSVRYAREGGG